MNLFDLSCFITDIKRETVSLSLCFSFEESASFAKLLISPREEDENFLVHRCVHAFLRYSQIGRAEVSIFDRATPGLPAFIHRARDDEIITRIAFNYGRRAVIRVEEKEATSAQLRQTPTSVLRLARSSFAQLSGKLK